MKTEITDYEVVENEAKRAKWSRPNEQEHRCCLFGIASVAFGKIKDEDQEVAE